MPKRQNNQAKNTANRLTGQNKSASHKVRSSVKFSRPKTRIAKRAPRVIRSLASHIRSTTKHDDKVIMNQVLLRPIMSDKNMTNMEKRNTISFIVNPRSNKNSIRRAFAKRFNVKVAKVNTLHTPTGEKKAYIRLGPDSKALEIASKIGII